MQRAILALAMLAARVAAEYEWIGVFDVSDDTTHTWSAQMVDGAYADATMKLVLIATSTATAAGMEALEATADTVFDGTCTAAVSGDTLTPTTAGVCYTLTFDTTASFSKYTIDTSSVTGLVIAAEHVPTEFECSGDTWCEHYLYSSTAVDNEPIAQESADTRYAYFTCNADGTISYGEECTDDACTDCEVGAVNAADGSCYTAGGLMHVATCNAAKTNMTVNIYEDTDLVCPTSGVSPDVSGCTPDQTHTEPSAGCKMEAHEHGDEPDTTTANECVTISGAGRASASLAGSFFMAAALLLARN